MHHVLAGAEVLAEIVSVNLVECMGKRGYTERLLICSVFEFGADRWRSDETMSPMIWKASLTNWFAVFASKIAMLRVCSLSLAT